MKNNFERIPEELRQLRQWHVWRQTEETKIPLQVNGSAAKSNDPNTWTDFATAARLWTVPDGKYTRIKRVEFDDPIPTQLLETVLNDDEDIPF
jgi:hypothetical protein